MRQSYLFLKILLAGGILTACSGVSDISDPVKPSQDPHGGAEIVFTRASGADWFFTEGDEISVYALAPIAMADARYIYTTEGFSSKAPIRWKQGSDENVTFVAFSPVDAGIVPTRSSYFEVSADQSTPEALKRSDLIGAVCTARQSDGAVSLPFAHMMSRICVRISGDGARDITAVSISEIKTGCEVNILSGAVSQAGDATAVSLCPRGELTDPASAQPSGIFEWEAIVPAQQGSFSITTTSPSGTAEFTSDKNILLAPGKALLVELVLG